MGARHTHADVARHGDMWASMRLAHHSDNSNLFTAKTLAPALGST